MPNRAHALDAARLRERAARLIEESRGAGAERAPPLLRLAAECDQLADELERLAGRERQPD